MSRYAHIYTVYTDNYIHTHLDEWICTNICTSKHTGINRWADMHTYIQYIQITIYAARNVSWNPSGFERVHWK